MKIIFNRDKGSQHLKTGMVYLPFTSVYYIGSGARDDPLMVGGREKGNDKKPG